MTVAESICAALAVLIAIVALKMLIDRDADLISGLGVELEPWTYVGVMTK